jgi:hypothetical protein
MHPQITIQPHTITPGPPVVCKSSEKNPTSYPQRGAHQTEEKHGTNTSDDTDDGERDTKVLYAALPQKTVQARTFEDDLT